MKINSFENKDPRWQKTPVANLVLHVQSGNYYARIRVRGKLIWKSCCVVFKTGLVQSGQICKQGDGFGFGIGRCSQNGVMAVLAVNRLLAPRSELFVPEQWFPPSVMDVLLDTDAHGTERDPAKLWQ